MFELALLCNFKIMIKMKVFRNLFLIVVLFTSCTAKQPNYTVTVFEVEKGWGYSIFEKEKLIIRQQYIPSINHQIHFKTKKDALTIGKIVIEKLNRHKSPSISSAELKNSISL